ncbi:AAA family ATPase [Oryzifoliimicrobium ureilyticus]|uniref:AAA family ATPase n=1 Tax=Oryzifoliimicrobium ureilyticus TaxID=3113724 RepID=UPI0030763255
MNTHVSTTRIAGTSWERPLRAPEVSDNKSEEDIKLWWELVDRVIEVGKKYGWSKAEVTRRSGMKEGTFSQWFSGTYAGRLDGHNATIQQWLSALEESSVIAARIPVSKPFMSLKGSTEVHEALLWAQRCPDLVMITLGPGMSKTMTCQYYAQTRPYVFLATVSENTKTVHGMLTELAAELDVQEHNPAKLARAIGSKVRRKSDEGSLLIVDEAQHLNDEAINQLRHFVDVHKCGVAIVGNAEVYGRFRKDREKSNGPSYAQLKSRIGKRLQRTQPYMEDLQAFIAAWDVTDQAAIKFLIGIGMKGGAFRQIDKTMKLATMHAMGRGEEVSLAHIQAAWKNRDVEDFA